jgi:hypothetical protein
MILKGKWDFGERIEIKHDGGHRKAKENY